MEQQDRSQEGPALPLPTVVRNTALSISRLSIGLASTCLALLSLLNAQDRTAVFPSSFLQY
jgi:hypothetical protein